jgi:hypothetical protein
MQLNPSLVFTSCSCRLPGKHTDGDCMKGCVKRKRDDFRSWNGAVSLDTETRGKLTGDCKLVFATLGESTFWLASDEQPRTTLESLAHSVFLFHTRHLASIPPDSGAEFWVQVNASHSWLEQPTYSTADSWLKKTR